MKPTHSPKQKNGLLSPSSMKLAALAVAASIVALTYSTLSKSKKILDDQPKSAAVQPKAEAGIDVPINPQLNDVARKIMASVQNCEVNFYPSENPKQLFIHVKQVHLVALGNEFQDPRQNNEEPVVLKVQQDIVFILAHIIKESGSNVVIKEGVDEKGFDHELAHHLYDFILLDNLNIHSREKLEQTIAGLNDPEIQDQVRLTEVAMPGFMQKLIQIAVAIKAAGTFEQWRKMRVQEAMAEHALYSAVSALHQQGIVKILPGENSKDHDHLMQTLINGDESNIQQTVFTSREDTVVHIAQNSGEPIVTIVYGAAHDFTDNVDEYTSLVTIEPNSVPK